MGPTTPFVDPQEQDLLFDVTGIETGSIAGYDGAGTNRDEIASFHAGTVALEATGRTDESIDGTIWRELWTGGGATAWVDDGFLSLNTTATVPFADVPCSGFGTPNGEIARSRPSSSRADHVLQIWQVSWPECTRVVLALGTEFDFDDAAPLASVVPGDVSVEAFGTWVRVTLPGIEATRPDAAEDIGDATIVAARTADGVLVADVHAGGPGEYFAQFLSNPARIVIDILPANAAASILAAPLIGEGVVLTEDLPPSIDLPFTITGYSRWFEASGVIVVRRLDKEPGLGEVVGAVVRGEFVIDPGVGTEWGIMATTWLDAWGIFTFELDGLGSGSYELFVGECRSGDGDDTCVDVGVYLPLIVGG